MQLVELHMEINLLRGDWLQMQTYGLLSRIISVIWLDIIVTMEDGWGKNNRSTVSSLSRDTIMRSPTWLLLTILTTFTPIIQDMITNSNSPVHYKPKEPPPTHIHAWLDVLTTTNRAVSLQQLQELQFQWQLQNVKESSEFFPKHTGRSFTGRDEQCNTPVGEHLRFELQSFLTT